MRGVRVVVLIAATVACRDPDQLYRHYATYGEAVAAEEVQRGWLPAWVPASATDVHIQGNIDTNESWLRFDVPRISADSLRRGLKPLSAGDVQVRKPSGSRAWWFEGLIEQQPANDAALYADIYRGDGNIVPRSVVIAFDRTSGRVYAWPSPP